MVTLSWAGTKPKPRRPELRKDAGGHFERPVPPRRSRQMVRTKLKQASSSLSPVSESRPEDWRSDQEGAKQLEDWFNDIGIRH